jgi:plasmid stability protein
MDVIQMYYGGLIMPVNVSIKNVPDNIVDKLRKRAKRHHRSLQGELIAIMEESTENTFLSVDEAEEQLNALGFKTRDESTNWTRELRNAR